MTEIYLNNAGTTWPKAPGVQEAIVAALEAHPRSYVELFGSARERIAEAFGIGEPESLVLTPGCTSSLAAAITSLPWQSGDVVVTSALEHEAMLSPIQRLQRLRGVVHEAIGGRPFDLEALKVVLALARGRVRLVAITGASNVTGERLDVAAIVEVAHQAGALVLLDAAQIAGVVELDVGSLGVDMLAFAGHKGPLGPQGIGGLWMRPGIDFGDGEAPSYCDLGSTFLAGAAGLARGLTWLASAPPTPAMSLRRSLRDRLSAMPGISVLGGDGPATGTLSFRIAGLPLGRAEAHFAQHGVVVRAGRHCAAEALATLGVPDGSIRISFGPFNTSADLEAVVAAIGAARG